MLLLRLLLLLLAPRQRPGRRTGPSPSGSPPFGAWEGKEGARPRPRRRQRSLARRKRTALPLRPSRRAAAAAAPPPAAASPSPPGLVTSGVVARAAEALGAAAQANPPVQDWFLDGGALEAVLGLLREGGERGEERSGGGGGRGGKKGFARANTERAAEVRQKALMALSCLVRNCDRGTDALVAAGGVETVVEHALAAVGEAPAGAAGEGTKGGGRGPSTAPVPAPRVARKAFQVLASLFRDRPTEGCLRFVLSDASFARAAARALRGGDEEEGGGGADVRLAAAAAVEALAGAAAEAGLPLESISSSSSSPSPVSLLLRAALETAESSARERAERAAKRKDEHARDWAEEEAAAAAAALAALALEPGERKREEPAETEEKKKPAVVLSLPAP